MIALLARAALVVAAGVVASGCYLSHGGGPGPRDGGPRMDAPPPLDDGGRRDAPMGSDGGCAVGETRRLDPGHAAVPSAPAMCPPFVAEEPCPGFCGNGVVDVCALGMETCEGGGAVDCPAGFSGGVARCGSNCRIDVSGCDDCAGAPSEAACGSIEGSGGARAVAAAPLDAMRAVVAWVTRTEAAVAIVDRDLRTVAGPVCVDTGGPSSGVAVAAAPGGLLVAVGAAGSSVRVLSFDASLSPRGSAQEIPDLSAPLLAARPDGGPLLTGSSMGGLHALSLSPEGVPAWRIQVYGRVTEPHIGSVVWAGDRFLVAMRHSGSVIGVATITEDGTVTCRADPSGDFSEYPQIAWTGRDARITWAEFGSERRVVWAALDATGALREGPIAIRGGRGEIFNPAPTVVIGDVTLTLAGGYTGGTYSASHLELHRFDASGRPLAAAPELVVDNPTAVGGYRLVRWGDELLAAWVRAPIASGDAGPIGLARLVP